MIQLLIVDDEVHVVERLTTTIQWQEVGVEQVYSASSAIEALTILEKTSIDIVLTDIRMPEISGIEMIGEINRRWPKTKCILLSGFSDFNYAKEAILQKTEDYLLKPVTEQDLLTTIQRVIHKLSEEWNEVISKQRLLYTFKENLPLLRGNLLNDLLQGRQFQETSLREKMQMMHLPNFINESTVVMVIRLEENFLDLDPYSLSLLEYAVGNMVEELFAERFQSWHTKDVHDYLIFVMLLNPETPVSEASIQLERTASQLQSAVKNVLKGSISILISNWGIFPNDLTAMYNTSVKAFRNRIGNENELLMRLDEDGEQAAIPSLQVLYEPPTLHHLLEATRWTDIADKLRAVFDEIEVKHSESHEHLLEAYFTIASSFTYIAHKNGRHLQDLIGVEYNRITEGVPFRSVNQLKEWSLRALQRLKEDMDQETKNTRRSLINEIRSFVERQISHDVSLQTIADHVYLHPVYVSKIYKLETGVNLSEYVLSTRMNKAEYLLKNSQEKIYEIAAHLGYQRPHSFNHAFKKYYGKTPQEYRDLYS